MQTHLTRQQVNDFKSQLMSYYLDKQQELENELLNMVDKDDDELEGCIDLLFDIFFYNHAA
ncbi:MAG: hypothetical protein ACU84J_10140 [Gammaproteobacteria bacterium]